MQNLVGQTVLHQYEIQEQIGGGGQAVIFRAYDRVRGIHVVLKLVRRDHVMRQDYRNALQEEVSHLASLSHPHIVQYFDSGELDDSIFLVMRLIEGDSLKHYLKRKPLYFSPANAIRILSDIAKALDYIHIKKILHRDIKPANIMLDKNGEAILIDLGIATNIHNTGNSASVGTPSYMSPEQCAGELLTPRSDIYSLGLVAYELFTKKRLFDGDTKYTLNAQQKISFEQINQLPREYQAAYPVFARVLAKSPSDRYPTARTFVDDLNKVLGMPYDTRIVVQPPPITSSQPFGQTGSKSQRIVFIMVGAILALVVALAAVLTSVFGSQVPGSTQVANVTPATSTRIPSDTPQMLVQAVTTPQPTDEVNVVNVIVTSTRNNPTATYTVTPSHTPTVPTNTPTATKTITSTPYTTTGRVNITTAVLRVRSLPDVDSQQVAALPNQETVTLTGRDPDGDWLRVRLSDGQVGWVTSQYIVAPDTYRLPVIRR